MKMNARTKNYLVQSALAAKVMRKCRARIVAEAEAAGRTVVYFQDEILVLKV